MKILLINLDESSKRLDQQEEQFKTLKLEFVRLSAVSTKEISKQDYEKLAFRGQRPMKESELACFLSHKKAWKIVLEKNEACLILEDDALLVNNLKNIINDCENISGIDYISLEHHGKRKLVSKKPYCELPQSSCDLFNLYQDRSGAAGYILYPSGANKLLNQYKKSYPKLADEFITSCYSLKSFQLEPAAVIQADKAYLLKEGLNFNHGNSIIGETQNRYTTELSFFNFLMHKRKRIKEQVILAMRYLLFISKSHKRFIKLDKDKFYNW